jgi:hypothetical protein
MADTVFPALEEDKGIAGQEGTAPGEWRWLGRSTTIGDAFIQAYGVAAAKEDQDKIARALQALYTA